MTLPIVQVEISEEVIIPCPAVGFQNRWAAKSCPDCEHFNGIVKKGENGVWQHDYAILCGHPIERNCHVRLEVIED